MRARVQYVIDQHLRSVEDVYGKLLIPNDLRDTLAREREYCIAAVEADPTPNKRYLAWLLRVHWRPGAPNGRRWGLPEEDLYRYTELLQAFDRNKHRLPIEKRDINRYRGEHDLLEVVGGFIAAEEDLSSNAEKRQARAQAYEEAIVHLDEEDWKLVEPLSKFSSMWWGRGTRWCTAAKRHNAFDSYTGEKGRLFIVLHPDGTRFQFHLPSLSLMDASDRRAKGEVAFHGAPEALRLSVTDLLVDSTERLNIHARLQKLERLEAFMPGMTDHPIVERVRAEGRRKAEEESPVFVDDVEGWTIQQLPSAFALYWYLKHEGGMKPDWEAHRLNEDDPHIWRVAVGGKSLIVQLGILFDAFENAQDRERMAAPRPLASRSGWHDEVDNALDPTVGRGRFLTDWSSDFERLKWRMRTAPQEVRDWYVSLFPTDPFYEEDRRRVARTLIPLSLIAPYWMAPEWVRPYWTQERIPGDVRYWRHRSDPDYPSDAELRPIKAECDDGTVELVSTQGLRRLSGIVRFENGDVEIVGDTEIDEFFDDPRHDPLPQKPRYDAKKLLAHVAVAKRRGLITQSMFMLQLGAGRALKPTFDGPAY